MATTTTMFSSSKIQLYKVSYLFHLKIPKPQKCHACRERSEPKHFTCAAMKPSICLERLVISAQVLLHNFLFRSQNAYMCKVGLMSPFQQLFSVIAHSTSLQSYFLLHLSLNSHLCDDAIESVRRIGF